MLSTAQALEMLLALAPKMSAEEVVLADAVGRVLAQDVVAGRDQPPFSASAMDGYAVRFEDATQGARLDVTGEAAAGRGTDHELHPGQAIRIFTGAPVPRGADTILIQENAEPSGNSIRVAEAPGQGDYIRPAGGDFRVGDRVEAGRRLRPSDIALIAAMNCPAVSVTKQPTVALIPTGDELVLPGEAPGPDQIVSSNNYGLAGMLSRIGALPRLCPIARDTRESLLSSLHAAQGADIVVTLGGASVGDHDLVAEVFGDEGLDLAFYKIAMRPGKPLMAGRLAGMAMVGLPGNPVSSMVCGEIFLRPMIELSLGLPGKARSRSKARLSHDLEANGPREHYMRAVIVHDAEETSVEIFENQDSSRLRILALANALVVRAPHAAQARAGEFVDYIPLN